MRHSSPILFPCRSLLGGLLACPLAIATLSAQPIVQTVFYDMPTNLLPTVMPTPTAQLAAVPGYPDDPARMTFIARLYLPDPGVHGPGPYPAVLFLHGSGGLWANNTIPQPLTTNNSPASQFRNWGDLLVTLGYAALFPDSFNLRGIPGNFEGRSPHHDPAQDDALCSPNYERPKDVLAAIEYLSTRPEVDSHRLALIGFSHGAQTGMNSLLDASVNLGTYQVDYTDLVPDPQNAGQFIEQGTKKTVPPPVPFPDHLPVPRFCAFYYGGGAHYGYHGQASTTTAGRYMLDRRTTAILFHGTGDSLMGITNHAAAPITGTVFPLKQALASANQAATLGLPNPIVRHYILDRTAVHAPGQRVGHSFDLGSVTIAAQADWDTAAESPNQKARRLARDEVLRWLEFKLKPAPALVITPGLDPTALTVSWSVNPRLVHLLQSTETLASWPANDIGALEPAQPFPAALPPSGRIFFRLRYAPAPAPIAAPENNGFFRTYSDFGL
jgi:Dienelactone hydrolase family